jgi:hypothetical protein
MIDIIWQFDGTRAMLVVAFHGPYVWVGETSGEHLKLGWATVVVRPGQEYNVRPERTEVGVMSGPTTT